MKVSLLKEFERVFHASKSAILCAVSHGQVTVDGHTIKLSDDKRWARRQLVGRMAAMPGREARLFGGSQRATEVEA